MTKLSGISGRGGPRYVHDQREAAWHREGGPLPTYATDISGRGTPAMLLSGEEIARRATRTGLNRTGSPNLTYGTRHVMDTLLTEG